MEPRIPLEQSSIPHEQDTSSENEDFVDSDQHRRIIICCDGTWNDRETNQPLTNVTRIQSCFAVRDKQGNESYEQLSYYIDGIGTGTTLGGAIHDGSTGRGIERKIRKAYRHLCLTYTDKKDEVILIGFSRGAFTVSCLASLIHDVGLLDGAWVNKELPENFRLWKSQMSFDQHDDSGNKEPTALEKHCQELVAKYDKPKLPGEGHQKGKILRRGVHIKACAVWDTVKSLGFPWPKRVPHKESKQYDFVNYRLTPNIENAFQALSLDERRWQFRPVIWCKSQLEQTLKQCWFLGSHSDIGGGYRNAGFANISLCWMISQLRPFINFNEEAIWHSTEDGRILGIDVAKENRELLTPGRGRTMPMANRISPFPRARSGPPGEKIRSNSRDLITPYEASLNPEAEAANIQDNSDVSSLATSDADGPGQLSLAISNIRRHTGQGLWFFGGSKTRDVGIHRASGDDYLGSNESIHFSVRVLTEIHPLQRRARCRALKKFRFVEDPGGSHCWQTLPPGLTLRTILQGTAGSLRSIPQDTAGEFELAMLHRWLDRDFAARETLGGQNASEAIAGSILSPVPWEEAQATLSIP